MRRKRERGGCSGDERADGQKDSRVKKPQREPRAPARAGKGSITLALLVLCQLGTSQSYMNDSIRSSWKALSYYS